MKAVYACLLQKGNKDRKLFHQNSGIPVMGIFLADRKLKINGYIRKGSADCGDGLAGKAGSVFWTSPVPVFPAVVYGGRKASAHPVAMDLNDIESGFFC